MTSRRFFINEILLPCLAIALSCSLAALAEPVTGIVTNKTISKPSPNDDVVLLQLAQGMQELARTKTDARGHFTIDVPADGLHLLRVTHDKANYFKPIQPGTQSVDIDVYSAAASVQGVQLDADVMRIETDAAGSGLNVVEHFFVKNDSTPATTLMNAHPFELYLPAGATIQGSAAKAPGGMAVQSPLVPEDEPNKYTMIFPIRPGESEFQVSYRLSYKDAFTFKPRPVMATDTIAVMMPKAMTFKPASSSPYSPVTEELGAQTYVARNVQPSMPLEFTVSGSGQLPRETQTGDAGQGGPTSAAARPRRRNRRHRHPPRRRPRRSRRPHRHPRPLVQVQVVHHRRPRPRLCRRRRHPPPHPRPHGNRSGHPRQSVHLRCLRLTFNLRRPPPGPQRRNLRYRN